VWLEEVRDAAPRPREGGFGRRVLDGIALDQRDAVPGPGERQGGGEAGGSGPQHSNVERSHPASVSCGKTGSQVRG
jgi:hypothetical protein